MRMTKWGLGIVVLALLGVGCAASDASEPTLDADEAADEVRTPSYERFLGAWDSDEGSLAHVVFSSTLAGANSREYFAERVVQCIRAPCYPVREDGAFRATTQYLYLTRGTTTERFRWHISGDSLELSVDGRTMHRFHRAVSYCDTADDCAGQTYPVIQCVGSTVCDANRCARRCGPPPCTSNAQCGSTQYCATATCGGTGTCTERPQICTALYNPVCGCNGRTYSNSCSAASAGQSVASSGACSTTSTGAGLGQFCGGIAAIRCQTGLRCQLDGSYPDAGGHCVR